MDTHASVLILAVVAALCFGQACAIKCYDCDSLEDKHCDLSQKDANKDNLLTVECDSFNHSCWHQESVTSSRDGYEWVESGRHVMRGCGVRREGDSRDYCKSFDANGGPIEACYCPDELCNSATSIYASIFCIFVSMLICSLKLWR